MVKFKILLAATLLLVLSSPSQALDRRGRLGIGYSNELQNSIPTISLKLQKSKSFSFGALLNFSTDENKGGFGAGLKFYKIIFDEPQMNLYTSFLAALIRSKSITNSTSGFEADFALGSEFHFQGLSSLGFSFEFGVSMYNINKFVIQTQGNSMINAGVHFYL